MTSSDAETDPKPIIIIIVNKIQKVNVKCHTCFGMVQTKSSSSVKGLIKQFTAMFCRVISISNVTLRIKQPCVQDRNN